MCNQPNHQFLRSVVSAHGPQLIRFFATQLRDSSEAEDLVQEVYLRILKLARPDLIRHPKAYVLTIAASVVYEHRQKRWARPLHIALERMPADALPVDEAPGAMLERLDQLAALLSEVPAKVRAALIWAHRDGYTYEEIGARLAVSKNRVKKYLTRALAHCRAGKTLEAVTS